jgi:Flp pilus assembly protein TadB
LYAERALLAASALIAGLIALPTLCARYRRRSSQETSLVAAGLAEFAMRVRLQDRCLLLEPELLARAERLRIPEFVSFLLALEIARPHPEMLADTAQRLSLRLKRRVAFERKMLARTAAGRRRGAIAAATPPLVLLAFAATGHGIPSGALLLLVALEAFGCWLLWRVARVEI